MLWCNTAPGIGFKRNTIFTLSENEHYEHAIHCDKAHGDVRNASFSDYKINVKITSSEAGKLSENVYNRLDNM